MDHLRALHLADRHQRTYQFEETLSVIVDQEIEDKDKDHILDESQTYRACCGQVRCSILYVLGDLFVTQCRSDPLFDQGDLFTERFEHYRHMFYLLHIQFGHIPDTRRRHIDDRCEDDQNEQYRRQCGRDLSGFEEFDHLLCQVVGRHGQQYGHGQRQQERLIDTVGTYHGKDEKCCDHQTFVTDHRIIPVSFHPV